MKKRFVTHGDYTSIAKFLDKKKSTSIPGGIFGIFLLHFEIGINLRHDFSRKPLHDVLRELGWETLF